ncbi:hypothetical protein N875_02115 [Neisseria meningitidis LNP21362]|nr:hypothetical protein N875_02115 [Neisseria meningitidis LNP21362]KID53408.1 hypothetical protein N872_06320 [Neisseria meningitidis LNP27256]
MGKHSGICVNINRAPEGRRIQMDTARCRNRFI